MNKADVSDNPELKKEELAGLRPASETPRHIFEALPKRDRSSRRATPSSVGE
jgi:hypothetical protein